MEKRRAEADMHTKKTEDAKREIRRTTRDQARKTVGKKYVTI
jgi:hypothetical protein